MKRAENRSPFYKGLSAGPVFAEAQIAQKPGGVLNVLKALPRVTGPGTRNNDNTGETQVLGEMPYGAVKKPPARYLSEKIWQPCGIQAEAKWWLDSPGGMEIIGTGPAATLRAFGRSGMFFLNDSIIDNTSILPDDRGEDASSPKILKGGTKIDYGYMWWIGETRQSRADKAYFAAGIFGQYIYTDPKEKVGIVSISAQPKPVGREPVEPEIFLMLLSII